MFDCYCRFFCLAKWLSEHNGHILLILCVLGYMRYRLVHIVTLCVLHITEQVFNLNAARLTSRYFRGVFLADGLNECDSKVDLVNEILGFALTQLPLIGQRVLHNRLHTLMFISHITRSCESQIWILRYLATKRR